MSAGVHTTRIARRFEWFGLAVIKRYLERHSTVRDVHADPMYFSKGIDFIVEGKDSLSIDLKVDSYIGTDKGRKIRSQCNPDTNMILIETLSQLQYDRRRSDVPGWFYTSEADEIYYYYLAVINDPQELNELYDEYRSHIKSKMNLKPIEDRLIQAMKVDNDLLVTYDLREARKWLSEDMDKLKISYSGATNPTYVTVSLRIPRQSFLAPNGPGRNLGRIYPGIRG
ncbi:MAG: hypothetical protein WB661_03720 [Candidatus Bathyarchaeia archaeon]